jgi:hypothetical protein
MRNQALALQNQSFYNRALFQAQALPAYSLATGAGFGLIGNLYGFGYGNLYANAYAANNLAALSTYGGLGGYGLYGGGGAGMYGGYGMYGMYGYGTQWMMNPYEGYLKGSAEVEKANAEYEQTIQQARLVREETRRSALQTRRAMIEQADWERAHMPDPEKIRQAFLARELERARVSPPLADISSARSLNTLLRHLIAQAGKGAQIEREYNAPLDPETLEAVNLTTGDTRGNVGLLKDGGDLKWPQPLKGEAFKNTREDLDRLMQQAAQALRKNHSPDESTVNDLDADLKTLQKTLEANSDRLSFDDYIVAQRYLRELGDTLTALRDRNVANFFNGNWSLKARNVAELVQFMRDKGLQFAPATSSKADAAYTALYNALATFDAGLTRSVASKQ